MHAAMISDAHLRGLRDPVQRRLVDLLDGLEAERLYILGDLFHFWWGFGDAVFSEFVPVLAALERLSRRGVAITYVPGNHDFALGPFFTRDLGVAVRSRVALRLGGERYLLVHGDEADRSPGYALTRWLLRGPAFAALMRASGPTRARRIGLRLAGSSRGHGGDSGPLVQAQKAWAIPYLQGGFDNVVMGHSHSPQIESLAGGRFINLGDFHSSGTWLAVTEEGPELRGSR